MYKKRTITDILYLLLCVQLIGVCGTFGIYWIFNYRDFKELFFAIYFIGFAIFFTVMFYKLFKKTEIKWFDKIIHRHREGE